LAVALIDDRNWQRRQVLFMLDAAVISNERLERFSLRAGLCT
jgi:hypothetical protein